MELIKRKEMQVDFDGIHYETTIYDIGGYEVSYLRASKGAERTERICVDKTDFDRYLPTIYSTDDIFGNGKKGFEIQTTAYGAMSPAKIKEVVAGYEEALEVVEILTKEFIK